MKNILFLLLFIGATISAYSVARVVNYDQHGYIVETGNNVSDMGLTPPVLTTTVTSTLSSITGFSGRVSPRTGNFVYELGNILYLPGATALWDTSGGELILIWSGEANLVSGFSFTSLNPTDYIVNAAVDLDYYISERLDGQVVETHYTSWFTMSYYSVIGGDYNSSGALDWGDANRIYELAFLATRDRSLAPYIVELEAHNPLGRSIMTIGDILEIHYIISLKLKNPLDPLLANYPDLGNPLIGGMTKDTDPPSDILNIISNDVDYQKYFNDKSGMSLDQFSSSGANISLDSEYHANQSLNSNEKSITVIIPAGYHVEKAWGFNPFAGENRLMNKLVENDSPAIETSMLGDMTVTDVYPNPSADKVNLRINSPENEEIVANIFDMNGNLLRSYSSSVSGETILTFDTRDLACGKYLLRLNSGGNFIDRTIVR